MVLGDSENIKCMRPTGGFLVIGNVLRKVKVGFLNLRVPHGQSPAMW